MKRVRNIMTNFSGLRTYFTNSVVYDITSSDKTKMVASSHYDHKVRFWDTRLNEPVRIVELASKVTSLVLSPGKLVFCFLLY